MEHYRTTAREVLDGMPDVVFAVDGRGIFTLLEGPGLEAMGLEPGGLVGRSAFEVCAEETSITESLRRVLSGETIRSVAEVAGVVLEWRYSPLKDGAGTVIGAAGIAVASQRRNRPIERASCPIGEGWFARYVESSTDLVTVAEPDGGVRYVSPMVERLLGYSPEEFVGMASNLADLVEGIIHPEDRDLAMKELAEAAQGPTGPRPPVVAMRARHKDGSWRCFEGYINNLVDDPTVGGLVLVSRDVTERVQAEEEARRIREYLEALLEERTMSLQTTISKLEANQRALEEGEERHRRIVRDQLLRDLHDTAKQTITGTCMLIEASMEAQKRKDLGTLERLLETALAASQEAKRELANPLDVPRFVSSRDAEPSVFFTERVRKFGEDFGIATHVDLRASLEALRREELIVAHRSCVEASWNTAKHSGATNLWLSSRREGSEFLLEVRDDGCGFVLGKNTKGLGIGYMRSRAAEVGAQLDLISLPGQGTVVRLRFGGR